MEARPSQARADSTGTDRLRPLRRWILIILVLGLVGTVTELVLLEHYEQPLQFVPLVLIVAAVGVLWWEFRRHDLASRRATQIVMALFVLAGFVGFAAHFRGSAEYQLELNPDMSNWELLEKILHAKAPPLLAPGMMLQLGLLGLAYVFSDSKPSKE
jgi:uncharacterized membrane protein